MAEEWWSPHGKFKPLHQLNQCRLRFLRDQICAHFALDDTLIRPFGGLDFLDVGCGGGLIAEPMARLGANVMGIDADPKTIGIAAAHLTMSKNLAVDYQCVSIENLKPKGREFDVVLALEIVEHVDDLKFFLKSLSARVRSGGLLFISTINRNLPSYVKAIIGAEYVFRLLPRGTHHWRKFVKPTELADILSGEGLQVANLSGMVFDVFQQSWRIKPANLTVNYVASFKREG